MAKDKAQIVTTWVKDGQAWAAVRVGDTEYNVATPLTREGPSSEGKGGTSTADIVDIDKTADEIKADWAKELRACCKDVAPVEPTEVPAVLKELTGELEME